MCAAATWPRVYPRACGGTFCRGFCRASPPGLSPRVRGNLQVGEVHQHRRRSIPARAGEPRPTAAVAGRRRVYPRACGGTINRAGRPRGGEGLSPRVRGNPPTLIEAYGHGGSIPARAGEPQDDSQRRLQQRVYPRACGGTFLLCGHRSPQQGLSPRVRGNRAAPTSTGATSRSIPARAGEPTRRPWGLRTCTVYPRACGGTAYRTRKSPGAWGLSPRVRGNREEGDLHVVLPRSIPARAGEPTRPTAPTLSPTVYPRACGGTVPPLTDGLASIGLSPRVRGNHWDSVRRTPDGRSIPARAGEPGYVPVPLETEGVYPRACGGTVPVMLMQRKSSGLSPRVRGNLPLHPLAAGNVGAIPARAGEPRFERFRRGRRGVYPRACGGTGRGQPAAYWDSGLSPRVRGNRAVVSDPADAHGSIPARAGEPSSGSSSGTSPRVYPRACGGTTLSANPATRSCGLSPRVRGNHVQPGRRRSGRGSIPARAGEPSLTLLKSGMEGVYPRACGGTRKRWNPDDDERGLSPRVRGNPTGMNAPIAGTRSIPARAGEPRGIDHMTVRFSVYPRACGGTPAQVCTVASVGGLSPRVRGNLAGQRHSWASRRSIPARAGEPPCGQSDCRRQMVYPRACGGTMATITRPDSRDGLSPRVRGNRPPAAC